MPFWKKSEDPWDMEPGGPMSAAGEPEGDGESLLDAAKGWGEKLKTALRQEAAPEDPPERCPWCGKEMERRYITGGRDAVWLRRKKPGFLNGLDESVRLDEEGGLFHSYKTIWYCRDCGKAAMTIKEAEGEAPPEERADARDGDTAGEV